MCSAAGTPKLLAAELFYSRGPADAGTMRAITSPRSVSVISSPRFTLARTFDVSWFSSRIDTSPMKRMYYFYVLLCYGLFSGRRVTA